MVIVIMIILLIVLITIIMLVVTILVITEPILAGVCEGNAPFASAHTPRSSNGNCSPPPHLALFKLTNIYIYIYTYIHTYIYIYIYIYTYIYTYTYIYIRVLLSGRVIYSQTPV